MLNLEEIARREMIAVGFAPDFDDAVLRESGALQIIPFRPNESDQRARLWSSIDNATSRDLDQIEVAEKNSSGAIRVAIGIADVDSLVPKDSALDRHAAQNCASIYLGIATFPLLPPALSFDATSLLQDQDRRAIVTEFTLDQDGAIHDPNVAAAIVRNHAKLAYDSVGPWLENSGAAPDLIAKSPELAAQVRLQFEAAARFHDERTRAGALDFESIEPEPVVTNGKISALQLNDKNDARDLIENLMIAANNVVAQFLRSRGFPSIQRVVRTPARWPRIVELAATHGTNLPAAPDPVALSNFLTKSRREHPEQFADLSLSIIKLLGPGEYVVVEPTAESSGHFGLAVHDYAHTTAPNRRYADLIAQRLVKAALANQPPPYTVAELNEIATRCNDRASAARKIERLMRKVGAAIFLSSHLGETFDAIVTGASPKGVFVRLRHPPAEGRVVQGETGLDVGACVRVKLLRTIPEKGFIDFARVS